jgi:hypothetical protein
VLIEDFRGGMNRSKDKTTGAINTAWTIRNAHLTRGGEIEQRKAFVQKDTLANTFGLASLKDKLFVFGSEAQASDLDQNVTYVSLPSSSGAAMKSILDVAIFDSQLYVIAQYTDNSVEHFYNGQLVADWQGNGLPASVTDITSMLQFFADSINTKLAKENITATVTGEKLTVTGPDTKSFSIDTWAGNTGLVNNQTFKVTTTQTAQDSVPGVKSDVTFFIDNIYYENRTVALNKFHAGTKITSIEMFPSSDTVKTAGSGVELLSAAWTAEDGDLAIKINDNAIINGFDAEVETADLLGSYRDLRVKLTAIATGKSWNNKVFVVTSEFYRWEDDATGVDSTPTPDPEEIVSITPELPISQNGENALEPLPQITEIEFSGIYESTDTYWIKATPEDGEQIRFGSSEKPTKMGTVVHTHGNKMFALAENTLFSSNVAFADSWDADPDPENEARVLTGAGYINISNHSQGAESLTALATYQKYLAVFSREGIQVWQADSTAVSLLQIINNGGCIGHKSALAIADTDVLFLSDTGIRSLRARSALDTGFVNDTGSAIDNEIIEFMETQSNEILENATAIFEPKHGRYWLAIGNRIYVYSLFPASSIQAWSYYEAPYVIQDMVTADRKIWLRMNNNLYAYGGDSGNEYDDCEVEVDLPFLALNSKLAPEDLQRIDINSEGIWQVSVHSSPQDPQQSVNLGELTGITYDIDNVPVNIYTHAVSFRLLSKGAGRHVFRNISLYSRGEK